jgi:hypothetical protein
MALSSAFDHLGRTLDADADAPSTRDRTVEMLDLEEEGNV